MIYRQIGFKSNVLKLINTDKTALETLASTNPQTINKDEDIKQYKANNMMYFISGDIKANEDGSYTRNDSNLKTRNLIVIDIEDTGLTSKEVQTIIQEKLASYKYLLYSTISHKPNNPRLRLVLEPSRDIIKDEYKPTIQHIIQLLNIKYDTSSCTWSQLQGLPIAVRDNEFIFTKHLEGEPYPVQEAVKTEKKVITTYASESIKQIPHDQAISIMEKYVENEKENLQERNEYYLSCLTVIAKSVISGEIEKSTAIKCIELLALNNEEWEKNNLRDLEREINLSNGSIEYFKNDYTFKSKFEKTQQGIQVTNAVTQEKMKISTNENGKVIQTIENLEKIILSLIPVAYNELAQGIEIVNKQGKTEPFNNRIRDLIIADIEKKFNFIAKDRKVEIAFTTASERYRYHPIKQLIEPVQWDGIERAETFFIDVLGVEDNSYNRECTRKWLLAGIYRLFEPGTKFDEMLIIHGDQGISKSTTFKKLALDFYVSETEKISLETLIKMELAWFVDFTELATMKKTDIDTFKAWLSETSDTYRGKYDRKARVHERHFIICGTTNDKEILTDRTGNRRYWLMYGEETRTKLNIFDVSKEYILQLWSEVYQWYKNRETLLISNETKLHMRKLTSDALEYNPLEERVNSILEMEVPNNWHDYLINKDSRFKYYNYVNDYVSYGKSDINFPQQTQILDITTKELHFLLGNGTGYNSDLRGNLLAKDINKVMNNLPNWKKSESIKRSYSKRGLKGFVRKLK